YGALAIHLGAPGGTEYFRERRAADDDGRVAGGPGRIAAADGCAAHLPADAGWRGTAGGDCIDVQRGERGERAGDDGVRGSEFSYGDVARGAGRRSGLHAAELHAGAGDGARAGSDGKAAVAARGIAVGAGPRRAAAAADAADKTGGHLQPEQPDGRSAERRSAGTDLRRGGAGGSVGAGGRGLSRRRIRRRITPSFWGRYERTLCTGGLSKAYGLPGLRTG